MFNIVSQQSTARPGCIIELDAITNQVSAALPPPQRAAGRSPPYSTPPPPQCGATTQLLHVFQEDFILGYKPRPEPDAFTPAFPCGEGTAPPPPACFPSAADDDNGVPLSPDYQPAPFSEKFFLVVIEKDLNGNSVLQMWHLHLQSVQACVGESPLSAARLERPRLRR